MPTHHSHTHCQAAHSQRTDLSLSKSVSIQTRGRKRKKHESPTIAIKHALRDTFHSGNVSNKLKQHHVQKENNKL